jgi:hypothetical protein
MAGQHWQSFATQDYFDEHGIFYNTVISGPALLTLLLVLVRTYSAAATGWCFGLWSGLSSGCCWRVNGRWQKSDVVVSRC